MVDSNFTKDRYGVYVPGLGYVSAPAWKNYGFTHDASVAAREKSYIDRMIAGTFLRAVVKKHPTARMVKFVTSVTAYVEHDLPLAEQFKEDVAEYTVLHQSIESMTDERVESISAAKWKKYKNLQSKLRGLGLI